MLNPPTTINQPIISRPPTLKHRRHRYGTAIPACRRIAITVQIIRTMGARAFTSTAVHDFTDHDSTARATGIAEHIITADNGLGA
jgi:hypothetical protein